MDYYLKQKNFYAKEVYKEIIKQNFKNQMNKGTNNREF